MQNLGGGSWIGWARHERALERMLANNGLDCDELWRVRYGCPSTALFLLWAGPQTCGCCRGFELQAGGGHWIGGARLGTCISRAGCAKRCSSKPHFCSQKAGFAELFKAARKVISNRLP